MRNISKVLCIIFIIVLNGYVMKAQITLEQTYPGGSEHFYMVNLEISGMKYVLKSEVPGNRFLKFYNLNHSLWKTIDCNPFPKATTSSAPFYVYEFESIYISETLFDCNNLIEFLYISVGQSQIYTAIYNENGVNYLFEDSCSPVVKINVPQQFRPIYNTAAGTKMILSHWDGSARVYNLPCALSTGVDQLMPAPVEDFNLKIYPNPSYYEHTIEYSIPNEIRRAEIIILDIGGKEVKRYEIDAGFSNVFIEKNELPPGIYFYSLVGDGKTLITKKIILEK